MTDGWVVDDHSDTRRRDERPLVRTDLQRALILNDIRGEVPRAEYERQIDELRTAVIKVEGSRAYRYARMAARLGHGASFRARRLADRLPGPAREWLVRRRHRKHVTVNMGHLTDPAYLGSAPADVVGWIAAAGLPLGPQGGFELDPLGPEQVEQVRAWLADGPHDTDALLERRTDNHGDELGRTIAALRLRLRLADGPSTPAWAGGSLVLFDARCLQSPAFGNRGIGRFAKAALDGVRAVVGDDRLVLLVDHGLEQLPVELAGSCRQVARVDGRSIPLYGALVQPSPMTATADPLVPLLHSRVHKIAVVFDFIPMHYPTVYLRHFAARAEYAVALDALRMYDEFACISHLARTELFAFLGHESDSTSAPTAVVAWPRDVLPGNALPASAGGTGPIVVMTGDEPRKNTFGALAAIGVATAGGDEPRDVVVIGMAGQGTRVHHWSIGAAMRPGEARTLGRVTDDELHRLLAESSAVVVASFDEGLSLPVIEALRAGAPVVAADIPAHRELIGSGSFLADPGDIGQLAAAIRRTAGRGSVHARQAAVLGRHQHEVLEEVLGRMVSAVPRAASVDLPASAVHVSSRALRIGFASPWAPQRTGVADFSTTTTMELARLADVTVYTTAGADVAASTPDGVRLGSRNVDDVIAHGSAEDVFVSVVGNSHFHLPFIELTERVESVVLSHDTRLVELYMALRGRGGVEQVMLRGSGRRALDPPLDDQIADMRLLENAGFWEVARRARMLILHTPSAAPRIAAETGIEPRLLPFANQRAPHGEVTEQMRRDARARLGFDVGPFVGTVHVASFGFIDARTKMTDVVIESAAWLSQWGHRVSLHLAGAAGPTDVDALTRRAHEAGIANFRITGFLSDEQFRDYLLAVDAGLQLRISPLLGVSGPLSDLAAYGTPAVASRGLCVDVDTPGYIDQLPDDVSPVIVAEALEQRLAHPIPHAQRETMRVDYIARKSPRRYAEQLLVLLEEVTGGTP